MPSFLAPLLDPAAGPMVLRNVRTGAIVADRLISAFDSASRRTGLLKHASLSPGEAMVIAPTNAIHTFFMHFPIDVAFVDRDGYIVKICEVLKPWRVAAAWSGHAVIEATAKSLSASQTIVGDRLHLVPAPQPRTSSE